jgi:hypothetical protein
MTCRSMQHCQEYQGSFLDGHEERSPTHLRSQSKIKFPCTVMKRRSTTQIEGGGDLKETLTMVWAAGLHHAWWLAAVAMGVWPIRWWWWPYKAVRNFFHPNQPVEQATMRLRASTRSGPPYNNGPVSLG